MMIHEDQLPTDPTKRNAMLAGGLMVILGWAERLPWHDLPNHYPDEEPTAYPMTCLDRRMWEDMKAWNQRN